MDEHIVSVFALIKYTYILLFFCSFQAPLEQLLKCLVDGKNLLNPTCANHPDQDVIVAGDDAVKSSKDHIEEVNPAVLNGSGDAEPEDVDVDAPKTPALPIEVTVIVNNYENSEVLMEDADLHDAGENSQQLCNGDHNEDASTDPITVEERVLEISNDHTEDISESPDIATLPDTETFTDANHVAAAVEDLVSQAGEELGEMHTASETPEAESAEVPEALSTKQQEESETIEPPQEDETNEGSVIKPQEKDTEKGLIASENEHENSSSAEAKSADPSPVVETKDSCEVLEINDSNETLPKENTPTEEELHASVTNNESKAVVETTGNDSVPVVETNNSIQVENDVVDTADKTDESAATQETDKATDDNPSPEVEAEVTANVPCDDAPDQTDHRVEAVDETVESEAVETTAPSDQREVEVPTSTSEEVVEAERGSDAEVERTEDVPADTESTAANVEERNIEEEHSSTVEENIASNETYVANSTDETKPDDVWVKQSDVQDVSPTPVDGNKEQEAVEESPDNAGGCRQQ